MISKQDRILAVELIQETVKDGARIFKCCEVLEISVRTYQRWRSGKVTDKRKGSIKSVPRKLSDDERNHIITLCCSEEFKDSNPYEIFISLINKGTYVASIRTIYRILKDAGLQNHRTNRRLGVKRSKPAELKATDSNQVWTWDITFLPSMIKGEFFQAYVIKDIWDKRIAGWQVHEKESEAYAKDLFERALKKQRNPKVNIHSDNGNAMKGMTLLATLYGLGCKNSFSRPRVSNDNPFIESFFGTLKGSVKYPGKFETLEKAREWMGDFVNWYNNEHIHSGIDYFTPMQVFKGEHREIVKIRNEAMKKAKEKNPSRWGKTVKQWKDNHVVYLNPSEETKEKRKAVA